MLCYRQLQASSGRCRFTQRLIRSKVVCVFVMLKMSDHHVQAPIADGPSVSQFNSPCLGSRNSLNNCSVKSPGWQLYCDNIVLGQGLS